MDQGRTIPRWVKDGTFEDPDDWGEAPDRGDTIHLKVEFSETLETGDGEEWSSALLKGRCAATDELTVNALVAPTSKLAPKKLLGWWDVTLSREQEDQPWKLVKMTRRHG